MKELLVGIDVGTTTTKALLMDADGHALASASEAYPLITPGIGLCEQRAEDWWSALVHTVKQVCADPEKARRVRGISLSTQGGTLVPVDRDFRPLANAIVWSDVRCEAERAAFAALFGPDHLYRVTGWRLGRGLPAMELRHMRDHQSDLFHSAAYFLTVPDYIFVRLTGRPAVDLSNAGINQLTDIRAGRYDPAILDFAGVREDQLAPLVPSCQPIGRLTHDAALALGLPEDVTVSSGAHDQYAVALGAGICQAGDAAIGTGTAWVVTALGDEPDFESGFAQSLSATSGKWGSMLSISTGGVCLDWFRSRVSGREDSPLDYDELNSLAEHGEPGSGGVRFYPYFGGSGQPEPDGRLKGTFLGLDLSHHRGHMARAVMEGVACQAVWAMRVMERRRPMGRLFLSGGAAKSPVWTRIIAGLAGRPVYVPGVPDAACAGAAMMAGVGAGLFEDTPRAAGRMTQGSRVVEPEQSEAYMEVFDSYLRGARALGGVYDAVLLND